MQQQPFWCLLAYQHKRRPSFNCKRARSKWPAIRLLLEQHTQRKRREKNKSRRRRVLIGSIAIKTTPERFGDKFYRLLARWLELLQEEEAATTTQEATNDYDLLAQVDCMSRTSAS